MNTAKGSTLKKPEQRQTTLHSACAIPSNIYTKTLLQSKFDFLKSQELLNSI